MAPILVNADRVVAELDQLAAYSDTPAPAVTRVMLSQQDLAARAWLTTLMQDAGLATRVDAAGNLFARWLGQEEGLPAVATGSHCDAIPHSGKYDGTLGVVGAVEAVRALGASGWRPRRSIDVVMFTSEEPTRYGVGCLGSRLMSGRLAPAEAAALVDGEGVSFEERRGVLGVAGDLSSVRLPTDAYHAFIELHIEQAPLLEQSGVPIGAVSHIAAPAALRVEYRGEGGHAGAVLMPDRRDALLPAAELALAVRSAAGQLGGEDTVATTGVLEVHPGAVNSIPSRARLEIDIRDTDHQRRDRVLAQIESDAHAIGARHSQRSTIDRVNADPPATCATQVVEAVEEASDDSGLACSRMVSRAYHDSLFMAQVAPTGMIFIPCRGGVSHRPDEYASPEAIGAGVAVLAGVLRRLAG